MGVRRYEGSRKLKPLSSSSSSVLVREAHHVRYDDTERAANDEPINGASVAHWRPRELCRIQQLRNVVLDRTPYCLSGYLKLCSGNKHIYKQLAQRV